MRTGFLFLVGMLAAVALAFPAASSATGCAPPYCPSHTLTVKKAGTGSGTVTSSPAGISCGAQCSASYEQGTKVTLTATPAAGSTFAGWSGGGCSGTGACVVTIPNADVTVTATFNANPPPPPPPPNNFTLGKVKHPQTGVVTIRIAVPGPGTMTATGRAMKTVKARAKAGGNYILRLELTKHGMKVLRKSKGRQLRVKVSFTYTPTGGQPRTKIKKIIFRVVSPRAGASRVTFAAEDGGKVVVASTATVKPEKALIRVFCNGPQSCHGRLRLTGTFAPQEGKPKVGAALGSSSFHLAPGVSKVLQLRLTGQARHLFENRRPQQARATGTGLHPHGVKLKLASS